MAWGSRNFQLTDVPNAGTPAATGRDIAIISGDRATITPLGRISLEAFRSGNGFAIPLARLAQFRAARLVLVLRGAGRAQTFTIAIGGRS